VPARCSFDAPFWFVPTAIEYLNEASGFDCSTDATISALIPSVWIAQEMRLNWAGCRFRFSGDTGQTVAVDPSFEEEGPGSLLIRSSAMVELLKGRGLACVWYVIEEKLILDNDLGTPEQEKWLGRLVRRSAYCLRNHQVEFLSSATIHFGVGTRKVLETSDGCQF
jgi:hypothetical protein